MLETYTSVSSWFILSEVCCPQPRRPASPALFSDNRRSNNRKDSDWEEREEIKQILLRQLPVISIEKSTKVTPTTQVSLSDMEENLLFTELSQIHFNPTQSPVIAERQKFSPPQILLDSSDSDNDLSDGSSTYHTVKRKALRRPKLGVSTSNLAGFDRTEPVMTPPLRSHNPLPLNLQFRKVSEGAEFGLFSVSPPSQEDDDVLLRRERFKRKTKVENDQPRALSLLDLEQQQDIADLGDMEIFRQDVMGEVDVFGYVLDVELAH